MFFFGKKNQKTFIGFAPVLGAAACSPPFSDHRHGEPLRGNPALPF